MVIVTRYGIGARGIDYLDKTVDGDWQGCQFPVYDGHGNMVATLARSGSNSFTRDNRRTFDVWGGVRSTTNPDSYGGPKQRYCANLGHVEDGESGLLYMRARFYEPLTGRFVSEDRARHGSNWYRYAANDPVNRTDPSGQEDEPDWQAIGWDLYTLGVLRMTHGFGVFLIGMVSFYASIGLLRGTFQAAGLAAKYPKLSGAVMGLFGTSNMASGANMFVRGVYLTQAGKYLMALGEDGLEYAALYVMAASGGFGIGDMAADLFFPDPELP